MKLALVRFVEQVYTDLQTGNPAQLAICRVLDFLLD